MAMRNDAGTDYLSINSGLPSITAFTVGVHVKPVVDTNDYAAFLTLGDSDHSQLGTDGDGLSLCITSDSQISSTFAMSLNTWYHVVWVHRSNSDNELWVDGVIRVDGFSLTVGSISDIKLGSYDGLGHYYLNACIAGLKWWTTDLSPTEIPQERWTFAPRKRDNLYCFVPILSGSGQRGRDFSGLGHHWTENGALTDEDGPPIGWGGWVNAYTNPITSAVAQTITLSSITPRQRIGLAQLNQNVLPSAITPRQNVGLARLNENVSLAAIQPRQQVGSHTLVPQPATVTLSPILPKSVIGSDQLTLNLVLAALTPHQRLGLHQLNENLVLAAIQPKQQLGLDQLTLNVNLAALTPKQQIGLVSLSSGLYITLSAITPHQRLGLNQLNENLALSGIPPKNPLGTQRLNLNVLPNGITPKQPIGTISLVPGGVTLSLTSLTPHQRLGLAQLVPQPVTVTLSSITPRQQIGLDQFNLNMLLSAILPKQKLGLNTLNLNINPSSLPVRQQIGLAQIIGVQSILLSSLPYRGQIGAQRLNLNVLVLSLPVRQQLGLNTFTLANLAITLQAITPRQRIGLISIASAIGSGIDTIIIVELKPAQLRIVEVDNAAQLIIQEVN